jgi:flavin reductase (DIM6/NTAB) family NADH-FMN oxidoreductase RutF
VQYDLETLAAADRYELLLNTVVPRPIALITTLSPDGGLNAAPYSLFNLMSHDPPLVAVSVLPHAENRLKDTAFNILATGEFVVNLVSEAIAESMNVTCIDAPPGVNELELAQLETTRSLRVKPPRVTRCPISFECRLVTSLSFGANQAIILGRILQAHVADDVLLDPERCVIDTPRLELIGGMHGARWYSKTSDRFAMHRPTWAEWTNAGKGPR